MTAGEVLSFRAKEGLEAGVLDTFLLLKAAQVGEGVPLGRFLKGVGRSLHCLPSTRLLDRWGWQPPPSD